MQLPRVGNTQVSRKPSPAKRRFQQDTIRLGTTAVKYTILLSQGLTEARAVAFFSYPWCCGYWLLRACLFGLHGSIPYFGVIDRIGRWFWSELQTTLHQHPGLGTSNLGWWSLRLLLRALERKSEMGGEYVFRVSSTGSNLHLHSFSGGVFSYGFLTQGMVE